MLSEKLKQIGFTENESNVYLELLRVGPQAVSVVAKMSGLNRTTTYSVLKSLMRKGIISFHCNGSVKYYAASDPNSLVAYLDSKCKTYEYYKGQVLNFIPKFRALKGDSVLRKPVVSYFDGLEGVKHVMYDALDAVCDFRACLAFPKWFESGLKDFLIEYKEIRITGKKLKLRAMTPDTQEVRAFFDENYDASSPITDFLFVDAGMYESMFEVEVNIYDNKVSMINLDKGFEYGVIIESKEFAEMQKMMFDMAWIGLKKKND
ncbi:hypothetical protein COU74_03565 [Candidatus Peregrinibacteria bacterium CG10_big_fil_rev_8_21_14_0_10_36_19]|nr:MAG: hypothetical protein COU74_03565 [Candidatus Peregrinibacteria bacterium CG10_big_fil_rev_8_21_14_0_10_36_19]